MSAQETEQLNISRVAADVKARLVAEAAEQGATINDLLTTILADKYRVRFDPTGRRGRGAGTVEGPMNLRVPATLKRKVDEAVARQPKGQRSIVALVDALLRERYDLVVAAVA